MQTSKYHPFSLQFTNTHGDGYFLDLALAVHFGCCFAIG